MKIDYDFEQALFLLECAIKIWQSGDENKFDMAEKKYKEGISLTEKFNKKVDMISEWD